MPDVFLSYRRADSRSAAGRLMDQLQATFGADNVFRDVDSISPGLDFQAALQRAIGGAKVVLAIVGPNWLDIRDAAGQRRLDDPRDVVRCELEAALSADVPIIPVLVEGARMPAAQALPATLAPFARCQAITLDDEGWRDDTRRLVDILRERHAVEPGVVTVGMPPGPGWGVAARLHDLMELIVRPRALIIRLAGAGGARELQHAVLLLLVCLVLGNVLLGAALGVELASWVFNGTLLGALGCAAVAFVIALGWRVAGTRVGWQRVTAGSACLIGGAWLYACAGLLLVALGYGMVDPGMFEQLRVAMRGTPLTESELMALAQPRAHGPALAALVVATLVWLVGLAWIASAWNALRLALGAGHARALFAAVVSLGLLGAVIAAARWAAAL